MSTNATRAEMHKALSTNASTKFQPFSIKLKNGATLTGIFHDPPRPETAADLQGKPLLVGIHGTTCSAYTYDISPEYTASTYSDKFSVPFVAINRPNFVDSSGWLLDYSSANPTDPSYKASSNRTHFAEEAHWFHDLIFPALWSHFGQPNGCSSIVTTSHSMSVPPSIIAASLYSSQPAASRTYTWSGMVISGWAKTRTKHCESVCAALQTDPAREPHELPLHQNPDHHAAPFRQEDKADLLLGPPGLSDDSLRPLVWKQNTYQHVAEYIDMLTTWVEDAPKYKAAVTIPVLCALGEYDWVWQGNKANLDAFVADFVAAPRLEAACVEGAPHALELGKGSKAWWTRVFGWAEEVAVGAEGRGERPMKFEQ